MFTTGQLHTWPCYSISSTKWLQLYSIIALHSLIQQETETMFNLAGLQSGNVWSRDQINEYSWLRYRKTIFVRILTRFYNNAILNVITNSLFRTQPFLKLDSKRTFSKWIQRERLTILLVDNEERKWMNFKKTWLIGFLWQETKVDRPMIKASVDENRKSLQIKSRFDSILWRVLWILKHWFAIITFFLIVGKSTLLHVSVVLNLLTHLNFLLYEYTRNGQWKKGEEDRGFRSPKKGKPKENISPVLGRKITGLQGLTWIPCPCCPCDNMTAHLGTS